MCVCVCMCAYTLACFCEVVNGNQSEFSELCIHYISVSRSCASLSRARALTLFLSLALLLSHTGSALLHYSLPLALSLSHSLARSLFLSLFLSPRAIVGVCVCVYASVSGCAFVVCPCPFMFVSVSMCANVGVCMKTSSTLRVHRSKCACDHVFWRPLPAIQHCQFSKSLISRGASNKFAAGIMCFTRLSR